MRTIVVEADLRRPSLHRIFPDLADRNTPGLSDFLAGNEPLDSVIRASPIKNLSFILAGRQPPNPAELLASKAFPLLITTLLERFDRIICDSAPINAVSDTLTLFAAVQHVCLVVETRENSETGNCPCLPSGREGRRETRRSHFEPSPIQIRIRTLLLLPLRRRILWER